MVAQQACAGNRSIMLPTATITGGPVLNGAFAGIGVVIEAQRARSLPDDALDKMHGVL